VTGNHLTRGPTEGRKLFSLLVSNGFLVWEGEMLERSQGFAPSQRPSTLKNHEERLPSLTKPQFT
jgi:hypothetical protein